MLEEYLGTMVDVIIDRPLGSMHPKHNDIIYTLNYGYIPNTKASDGEEIDAYVLGEFEPLESFKGRVIAVINRKNDNEGKLVVAKTLNSYNKEQIQALTEFQERFFDIDIVCYSEHAREPKIRPIVLGLVRRDEEILVEEGYDSIKNETFYRFLGGGIEFGESGVDALKREFKEETNLDIDVKNYICTLENIFIFEKRKGHEIGLVYEIALPDYAYEMDEFKQVEAGVIRRAKWIDKKEFLSGNLKLYPEEIKKYL